MLGSHVFKFLSKVDSVESFMRYFCSEIFLTDINVICVNFKGNGFYQNYATFQFKGYKN